MLYIQSRVAWRAAIPLIKHVALFGRLRHHSSALSAEGCFQPTFSRDVVKSTHRQLANKSKGCFQPTFYRDVVAVTTQSLKVSRNRVFDVDRDPKTAEMTTSPKKLSIFHCSGQYVSVASLGRLRHRSKSVASPSRPRLRSIPELAPHQSQRHGDCIVHVVIAVIGESSPEKQLRFCFSQGQVALV